MLSIFVISFYKIVLYIFTHLKQTIKLLFIYFNFKKAVIDANIIPKLIDILQNADFKVKKEAAWAISNATLSGIKEPNQIR